VNNTGSSTALVVGASRGLGAEIVKKLCEKGFIVYGIARNEKNLEKLSCETGCRYRKLDISEKDQIPIVFRSIINEVPKFNLVILNAAIKIERNGFNPKDLIKTIDVNLISQIRLVENIVPNLDENTGKLVFISSLGDQHGMVSTNGYNVSKAALTILAKSLRMDFLLTGLKIKTILVRPGLIETDMKKNGRVLSFFQTSPVKAAEIIVDGIAKGKKNIAFPQSFRFLTWLVVKSPDFFSNWLFMKLSGKSKK